jgi:hypothetical protein
MSSTMPESATRRGLGESPADGCAGPSADASEFSSFSRATNWCLRERREEQKRWRRASGRGRYIHTYQRHLTLESYTRFFIFYFYFFFFSLQVTTHHRHQFLPSSPPARLALGVVRDAFACPAITDHRAARRKIPRG